MKATIIVGAERFMLNEITESELEGIRKMANLSHKTSVTLKSNTTTLVIASGTPWCVVVE